MRVQPYLFFGGRAVEAAEFYRRAVGAEVTALMKWKEMPNPEPGAIPPGSENKVMHMEVKIGDTTILGSDGHGTEAPKLEGFALTLTAADDAEAERLFGNLGEGGEVRQPMVPTFFASRFGMLTDRFGVLWMVLTDSPQQ